tara:strand:- start:2694 stop:4565 length:1872 start_codon:yes stop_codon:yes gene_type:complete
MLNNIRNGVAHNKITRFALVFFVAAFVYWGMGVSGLSFNKNYAVKVGNVEVSASEYFRAYQEAKQQIVTQLGGQEVSPELLKMFGIEKNVTDRFINQSMLEAYANSEDLFVDEKTIFELIKKEPAFRNEEGEFDKEIYKARLRDAQLTPVEFEKSINKRVQANLIATIMDKTVKVSDYELDMKVKHEQERRDIEVLTITAKDIGTLPKPTEEELNAIYEENVDSFKIAEKRSFKLLVVSKDALSNNNDVTDEEVKQYFDEHNEEFFTKPEFKVQQILVTDKETADKVLAQADLSTNFAKYVKQYSTDEASKAKAGDMGWLTADIFGADFENAMHSTAKGEVAKSAVKTVFGYHILKIADVKESEAKPFEAVKAQIKANLVANQAEEALDDAINTTLDMVSAGEKLDAISKELGFKVQQFTDIEATEPQKYTKTVFETELDEVSQDIDLGLNKIAFVEVTDIKDESVTPLEEVKSIIVSKFNQAKTAELMQDKADATLEAINADKLSFKDAAKKFKLTAPIKSVVSVARTGDTAKGISSEVAKAVFANETNALVNKTINNQNDVIIVKVLDSAQEPISAEQKEQLRRTLEIEKSDNLFESFSNVQKRSQKIEVNQQVIDFVVKQ